MISVTSPIRTERLVLRPYQASDLDAIADIRSRPDVMLYLYEEVQDRSEVTEALAKRMQRTSLRREGDGLVLAVELAEVALVIGDVSLRWVSETHGQGDIGFIFHPDYQGRGYASEAAREMLRIGFGAIGLHRIVGRCDARNAASAKLMERLSMRREAHLVENEWFKGEWGSEYVYAMLNHEWDKTNP